MGFGGKYNARAQLDNRFPVIFDSRKNELWAKAGELSRKYFDGIVPKGEKLRIYHSLLRKELRTIEEEEV